MFFSVSSKPTLSKGLEQDFSGVVLGPFSLCNSIFKKFFFYIYFIYLFFSVLGLCYCTGFSLVVASGSHSPAMVLRLPLAVASLVAKHWLLGTRAPVVETPGLSSCGSWALEHRLNICGTQA